MPIRGLTFQVATEFVPGHNETFDLPSCIKFIKNILIGHVRGLFQVYESPFPLNPTIIVQGVPNDLTCFLNGPLQIVKNQIIFFGAR